VARRRTGPGGADPSARPALTSKGEEKRALILQVAAELLARQGYAGTTLADIATAAGTYPGSLYYHFESREQLVEVVLTAGARAAMDHTGAAVAALPEGATARQQLEAAITAHVQFILERSPSALAGARAVGQLPATVDAPLQEVFREYGRLFASLFDAAVAEGSIDASVDVSVARMLVVGAANWTAEWFDPRGTSSAEEVGALLCRLVFDGIGARADPTR
jgi:AcrR family transcriptional regulator